MLAKIRSTYLSVRSVKGRLKDHFHFWSHDLGASDLISPKAFFRNNNSAVKEAGFVSEALQELVHSGCVVEVSTPPHVVNPLSVSIQSTGKKRLILDLRHVNFHVWKEKFKFEDIRTACNYLPYDQFMFKFDLKSGYHHLDILQEQQTFLRFSWVIKGIRKYFVFTVLPFGLSSAPYIFSKVVRVLVKYWRSHAVRITVYLDDGLGSAQVFDRCSAASVLVKSTLGSASMATTTFKLPIFYLISYHVVICYLMAPKLFLMGPWTVLAKLLSPRNELCQASCSFRFSSALAFITRSTQTSRGPEDAVQNGLGTVFCFYREQNWIFLGI